MSNVTKFLLFAFGLAVTCLLIVYFKRASDLGFDTSRSATKKLSDFNRELDESELTMYDGMEVTGSDVVNFIKKNLGEYEGKDEAPIYVYVKTGIDESTYRNGSSIQDIQNFTMVSYIKPVSKFLCEVVRDANKVIVGVTFKQE